VSMLFQNLLAQSAMAGWSDGAFCRRMAMSGLAMVTLGGYNVDSKAHHAALRASERRREFLVDPSELASHIAREASLARQGGAKVCVNLRFSNPRAIGSLCGELVGAVDLVELNLHCRQPEFIAAGSGEAMLARPRDIRRSVALASSHLPTLVKLRAMRMPRDLPSRLASWGALALHLDLMTAGEPRADIALLGEIGCKTNLPIIGNNSVRTDEDFLKMLEGGADMVSMARALLSDPDSARRILDSPRSLRAMAKRLDPNSRSYSFGLKGPPPSQRAQEE
jgi:TIM-barrel protein